MDEIHTPDSSRYFYSEGYEERFAKGEPQKQLSKEFVREWLMENDFQGKAGQKVPEMTPAIVDGISERYSNCMNTSQARSSKKAIRTISFPVSKRT